MKATMKKLILGISVFLGTFYSFAQAVPPPPPSPESGEIGGPATPIDMYVYLLGVVVPVIIFYYYRKQNMLKLN